LLSRTNKSTSRPRKKTIKKIAEIIGIPELDFYKGFDGDPYKNSGISDLELKKYSSGNALEYIRLFNHENNRFLEPDYASDFDFEPIYKTEVDLVKKFLRTNDNILYISSYNRNFSDYYKECARIEQHPTLEPYYDFADVSSSKWQEEINDNAIAKLTFLQEVNSMLSQFENFSLFVYANKYVHTTYVICNQTKEEFFDDTGLYEVAFENSNLLISEIKYNKLTNVISKKNSDNIIWPSSVINFSPEGLIEDKNIKDTEGLYNRFVKYYWAERSKGNNIINPSQFNKIKKKEVNM